MGDQLVYIIIALFLIALVLKEYLDAQTTTPDWFTFVEEAAEREAQDRLFKQFFVQLTDFLDWSRREFR